MYDVQSTMYKGKESIRLTLIHKQYATSETKNFQSTQG